MTVFSRVFRKKYTRTPDPMTHFLDYWPKTRKNGHYWPKHVKTGQKPSFLKSRVATQSVFVTFSPDSGYGYGMSRQASRVQSKRSPVADVQTSRTSPRRYGWVGGWWPWVGGAIWWGGGYRGMGYGWGPVPVQYRYRASTRPNSPLLRPVRPNSPILSHYGQIVQYWGHYGQIDQLLRPLWPK